MLELRFFIKNISDQILIYLISCCDEYISPTLKFVSRILFISSCSGGKRTKVPILLKRDVRSISNYKYFCVEIDIFQSLKFSKIEEIQFFELSRFLSKKWAILPCSNMKKQLFFIMFKVGGYRKHSLRVNMSRNMS